MLHSICQQIWKTQQWPQDWKKSAFIPIPKKGNAKECLNALSALISHTSKIMLKILQARMQQYVNCKLPDVQARFRKGRGTRDQIANICLIIEKAREFWKNMYFCFMDYAKAFDSVDHNKLWKILKQMGIPDHLTCLFRNLCAGQGATVRTGYGTTDWFQIGKGVRQGCIVSWCLLNLHAEYIMRNTGLDEAQGGIKIAGRNINNLRYTDDTTLMAESEELKSLLIKVKEESEKVGLMLNIQKTTIMVSTPITFCFTNSWRNSGNSGRLYFGGSKITADVDCSHEIKRCILLGRNLDSILKRPLLGIHTEETRSERDTCTPMFIAALFIIARTWKQPRCPLTDEWIRKLWYIYTMEYYSAMKKNSFESVLMRWMKLEPIIQREISQKDQYSILTHIYGIQKDGNDNPICKTEKEIQMHTTDFWTLWEKVRVGCFKRTASKHIYYQG